MNTENIKKHNTFFQWRKELRFAPILLEVLDIIEYREGYRGIYKVRWHILETDKVYTSVFPMAVDEQAQNVPFYISPWWTAVRYAFCIMFNQEFKRYGETDDLYWWLEEAPKNEAVYYIDEEEHNVSDIDAFYDYLVEQPKIQ